MTALLIAAIVFCSQSGMANAEEEILVDEYSTSDEAWLEDEGPEGSGSEETFTEEDPSEEQYTEEHSEERSSEEGETHGADETLPEEGEGNYQSIRNTDRERLLKEFKIQQKEEAEEAFGITEDMEISNAIYLAVPEILQKPELPTGCESVALTMALMYEGFDISKTTIASEFLLYNRENDNMALGYIGDPFTESGAGCYAPALVATALDFFEDQGYDNCMAYELTGTSLRDLLKYVSEGTPVVVWSSMYMQEPEFTEMTSSFGSNTYQWYSSEHCVVISGYDLENQTIQINDPLEGIVTRKFAEFEALHDKTGRVAMILQTDVQADTVSEEEIVTEETEWVSEQETASFTEEATIIDTESETEAVTEATREAATDTEN